MLLRECEWVSFERFAGVGFVPFMVGRRLARALRALQRRRLARQVDGLVRAARGAV